MSASKDSLPSLTSWEQAEQALLNSMRLAAIEQAHTPKQHPSSGVPHWLHYFPESGVFSAAGFTSDSSYYPVAGGLPPVEAESHGVH